MVDERIGLSELYERTGIQRQEFNTVYQFAALAQEHPEELAAAIQDVMSHYEAFAEGARSRFGQLFSEDRMINSILKIYEALV